MKYITPVLETDRLILKRGFKEDYEQVYEYDFTKLRDIGGEFEYVKQNKQDLEDFDTYADLEENVFDWIVYLKENNKPIANIVADREEELINATEISFNMHPNYWRNGYMKEAIIEVLNYLFSFGFDNVMCGFSEGNIKSENLNKALGFELYRTIPNAWIKDGIPITDYKTIISKEKFFDLYNNKRK